MENKSSMQSSKEIEKLLQIITSFVFCVRKCVCDFIVWLNAKKKAYCSYLTDYRFYSSEKVFVHTLTLEGNIFFNGPNKHFQKKYNPNFPG